MVLMDKLYRGSFYFGKDKPPLSLQTLVIKYSLLELILKPPPSRMEIPGVNPGERTKRVRRSMVRTAACQAAYGGSIPLGPANNLSY
jgi:hypothetical protein